MLKGLKREEGINKQKIDFFQTSLDLRDHCKLFNEDSIQ